MTSKLLQEISAAIRPSVGKMAESYATRLLSLLLAKSHVELYSLPGDFQLDTVQNQRLRELIDQITAGKPIAQLERSIEFCGYTIELNDAVLIPRPETELLTEKFLSEIKTSKINPLTLLEVGTGSGCITTTVVGTLIANKQSFFYIASEISEKARECTVQNLSSFNPKISYFDRKIGLEWDYGKVIIVADPLPKIERIPIQWVIANPPYLSAAEFAALDGSVKNYEPMIALTDSGDGLSVYRELATYIQSLDDQALPRLYLEISPTIADKTMELFGEMYADRSLHLEKDQFGRIRYLISA